MLNPYPALYPVYPALYPAPPNGHSGHFWAILTGEALGARDLGQSVGLKIGYPACYVQGGHVSGGLATADAIPLAGVRWRPELH